MVDDSEALHAPGPKDMDLLDPVRVKIGLINAHDAAERGGVVVVFLLFDNLLLCVVTGERTWHTRTEWSCFG